MAESNYRVLLLAQLVFVDAIQPLRNGVVTIDGTRIAAIDPYDGQSVDCDLGNAAIIAPLVNAHTHLEFSCLKSPLRGHDASFASWLEAVIDYRRSASESSTNLADAVNLGLGRSQAAGCMLVGEIATSNPPVAMSQSGVGGIRFRELIGISDARTAEETQKAQSYVNVQTNQAGFQSGLSPHAPYSVSIELLEQSVHLSRTANVPLAMHLAETDEEIRLLKYQNGPLAELLLRMGLWPPAHIRTDSRPLDYLKILNSASRSLVIHGNYLADDELAFLASRREHMTLVFCPRTHAYFGHKRWPLQRAHQLGVRIALGTDSCASNPDLSIWSEAVYIAEHYPEYPAMELLRSLTHYGYEALYGGAGRFGIGSPASFCVVALDENTAGLPTSDSDDPWLRLFAPGSHPRDVWWNGERLTLSKPNNT